MTKPPPKLPANLSSPVGERGPLPVWSEVLRRAGYPEHVLVLDFETYFDDAYSLKKMSTIEYIMDSRFEVLCLAYKFWDGYAGVTVSESLIEKLIREWQCVYGPRLENVTVLMQNAMFDGTILVRKYGFTPKYIIDLLGLSRAWNSRARHKLDNIAERWELGEKGETVAFKYCSMRTRAHCPPNKPPYRVKPMSDLKIRELCAYAGQDAELEWAGFKVLLPRFSRPEVELPLMQHTLELYFNPTILIDKPKADGLIAAMEKQVEDAVTRTGLSADQISKNSYYENAMREALISSGDNPEKYWKRTKLATKLADAKTDPQRELLLNHPDNRVRFLMEARAAIKSWPNHVDRVKGLVAQSAAVGGLLPIALKYDGAHTGRWSGDEGLNPQNLGGSKSDELIRQVRHLLCAPPGFKMVVTDASQIEARILAWLAGQDDLVARFKNREEIYCGFASRVLGVPIRKAVKPGHPKFMSQTMEDYYTWARDSIGKVGILGCIAEGTIIQTNNGPKSIECVTIADKVWDGRKFVQHEGAVYQGERRCIRVRDVWLTKDHEILTEKGWYQAQYLNTHSPEWVTGLVNYWSGLLVTGKEAELSPSNAIAPVVEQALQAAIVLSLENLPDVMRVLKRRLLGQIPVMDLSKNPIVRDFLIEFVRSLDGAVKGDIDATAGAVSVSTSLGNRIERAFYDTWSHFRAGITPLLKSTDEIMMATTNPETFDSLREVRTCRTWDIIRAGSNRRYQAGSMIVANCGYGMGTDKIFTYAKGAITIDMADKIKVEYRAANEKIVQFWGDIERAFKYTFKYGKSCELNHGLRFDSTPDCPVIMVLPSGREVHYPHVEIDDGRLMLYNELTHRWDDTWGGSLTENAVQAIARDVLGEAILAIEKRGKHVPFHCHDEVMCIVPDDQVDETLQIQVEELSREPAWGPGLPLAAEGRAFQFYQK